MSLVSGVPLNMDTFEISERSVLALSPRAVQIVEESHFSGELEEEKDILWYYLAFYLIKNKGILKL